MKRVLELLLGGIIFLVPSNLFISFFTQTAYNKGLFIDYLLPKLYLSDIFVLCFIIVFFLWKKQEISWEKTVGNFKILGKKIFGVTSILVLTIFIRQFFVENILASFSYLIHVVGISIFGYCLLQTPEITKSKIVQYAFLITVLFQSAVGLYQFYFQESFYGYHFLGEPAISKSIGIARETFGAGERALPYGTTAHPNVLAGVLVFYLIIAFLYLKKDTSLIYLRLLIISLPLILTTLWFTQSISAFISAVLATLILLFYFLKNKSLLSKKVFIGVSLGALVLSPLLLKFFVEIFSSNPSITRRVLLNDAAIQILFQNIFVGVGLNQFTVHVENYSRSSEVVRFVQPAHNLCLLWLSETGLLGLLLAIKVFFERFKNSKKISAFYLILLPAAVLDHYLITLQSGLLLTVITIFFIHTLSSQSEK